MSLWKANKARIAGKCQRLVLNNCLADCVDGFRWNDKARYKSAEFTARPSTVNINEVRPVAVVTTGNGNSSMV